MRKPLQQGSRVTIAHLGVRETGTVTDVSDDGRRVLVQDDNGRQMTFVLSRAIGQFVDASDRQGARLLPEG